MSTNCEYTGIGLRYRNTRGDLEARMQLSSRIVDYQAQDWRFELSSEVTGEGHKQPTLFLHYRAKQKLQFKILPTFSLLRIHFLGENNTQNMLLYVNYMLLYSPNPHVYSNSLHQWFSNDNDVCLPGWPMLAGIWGHKTQGNAEWWRSRILTSIPLCPAQHPKAKSGAVQNVTGARCGDTHL